MELDGPDVVEVSQEGEEAPLELVVPNLDLVVVSSTADQRVNAVEVNPTYRTLVLFEPIDYGTDAVVP